MTPYLKSFMKQYREDDRSYPSPEMQLIWRLEALEERREELFNEDDAYENPLVLTEDDIKYSLPEHLHSMRHIEAAIEIAEFELREKYGIIPEAQSGKAVQIIPFSKKHICA